MCYTMEISQECMFLSTQSLSVSMFSSRHFENNSKSV